VSTLSIVSALASAAIHRRRFAKGRRGRGRRTPAKACRIRGARSSAAAARDTPYQMATFGAAPACQTASRAPRPPRAIAAPSSAAVGFAESNPAWRSIWLASRTWIAARGTAGLMCVSPAYQPERFSVSPISSAVPGSARTIRSAVKQSASDRPTAPAAMHSQTLTRSPGLDTVDVWWIDRALVAEESLAVLSCGGTREPSVCIDRTLTGVGAVRGGATRDPGGYAGLAAEGLPFPRDRTRMRGERG
jgi:hypothetical protein